MELICEILFELIVEGSRFYRSIGTEPDSGRYWRIDSFAGAYYVLGLFP